MKFSHLATAAVLVAFAGGAAQAQPPATPTPGSVTGDWNGAHAPSDEKQYQEKVVVPVGAAPGVASTSPMPDTTVGTGTSASTDVTTPLASSATSYAATASVTTTTVTNGPIADTPENRAKYGKPMSRAGQRTPARGN